MKVIDQWRVVVRGEGVELHGIVNGRETLETVRVALGELAHVSYYPWGGYTGYEFDMGVMSYVCCCGGMSSQRDKDKVSLVDWKDEHKAHGLEEVSG